MTFTADYRQTQWNTVNYVVGNTGKYIVVGEYIHWPSNM
jgi:hypothetical protein